VGGISFLVLCFFKWFYWLLFSTKYFENLIEETYKQKGKLIKKAALDSTAELLPEEDLTKAKAPNPSLVKRDKFI